MPRVGSKQSIVCTPPATQRAIVTFCWLPPDRRRTSAPARASIWSVSTLSLTWSRLAAQVDQAPAGGCARRSAARCSRAPSAASAGPRRGRPRRTRRPPGSRRPDGGTTTGVPSTRSSPQLGRTDRRGCRTARPGPGPRAPRRPAPRPDRARTRRPAACVPEAEAAAGRGAASYPARARRGRRRAAVARGQLSGDLAEHQLDDPLLGAARRRRRRRRSRPRAARSRGRRRRRSRSCGGR